MGRPASSGLSAPARRQQEIDALRALLLAAPADLPGLAPAVASRLGVERLAAIVSGTRERLGGFIEVTDGPQGLLLTGPRGAVLAWAHTSGDGTLTGLMISPELRRDGRRPRVRVAPAVRQGVGRLLWSALAVFWAQSGWTASTRVDQAAALAALASLAVLVEGFAPAAAAQPRWFRRPLQAVFAVGLASVVRAPALPNGTIGADLVVGVAALLSLCSLLLRARRHRWGDPATLLASPLRGSWYVVQGGGRGINHHLGIPEQRGAVDLVQVGAHGTLRSRTRAGNPQGPERYRAFGAPIHSPCDGVVTTVVDGLEDQTPGLIRYGPPYGNHVVIDTGAERVTLAHLRPGTVQVAPGDRVTTGQLLAEVGNSGNSTEPHLHLQAERDGLGLDLHFAGDPRPLHRGRTLTG
ncbi:M23 family metallopeptidase [Streptacidiphilus jiangxiensis]|uniref:Peptidase family M23 n=1 Tax=Streptacidiphilus jiangxiensis TaxID=235985 RepID=A0A1H7ZLT7_STRJI|nr:M23 family metallopeptidase [Streptacidiphilus jiangxiensis]SEM59285.1 Peptidase family M23 [Streptacidiphilus jiangxiensis]